MASLDQSSPEEGTSLCPAEEAQELAGDGARQSPGQTGGRRGGKRKKKYSRHAKPPYTYLAMIALVIQAAPGRRLKLAQIIKEIGALFPFFKEGYQGWKDSIRHNLSSNPCFTKLLKDPAKPKAKGNFWTVDVSRIPPDALKLQNTALSRQDAAAFAHDLGPYVLQGRPYPGPAAPRHPPTAGPMPGSSFTIDSLLRDFQDVGLCGRARAGESHALPVPSATVPQGQDRWGPVFHVSGHPPRPWRPPRGPGTPRSPSSSSSSLSSTSSEEPDPGRRRPRGPRPPAKRPRLHTRGVSSSDSEGSASGTPAPSPLPAGWGQLPTSYSQGVAPNAVAPPSGPPFLAVPCYGCRPGGYVGPVCWGLVPGPGGGLGAPPEQTPLPSGPPMDLDHAEQGMPPNKSVYDVWMSHPADIVHPMLYGHSPGTTTLAPYQPL